MIHYAGIQGGMVVLVAVRGQCPALGVFLAQAAVAVSLLEVISSIEHYELFRREMALADTSPSGPGTWNSGCRVSNLSAVNLARHADHHLTASKRYQVLHTLDEAPQLPAGHSAMVLLAFAPPFGAA